MQFHQDLLRPYYALSPQVCALPKDTKAEMPSYKLRCVHYCAPFFPFQPGKFLTKTRIWGENSYESVMDAIRLGVERECTNATIAQNFPPK